MSLFGQILVKCRRIVKEIFLYNIRDAATKTLFSDAIKDDQFPITDNIICPETSLNNNVHKLKHK